MVMLSLLSLHLEDSMCPHLMSTHTRRHHTGRLIGLSCGTGYIEAAQECPQCTAPWGAIAYLHNPRICHSGARRLLPLHAAADASNWSWSMESRTVWGLTETNNLSLSLSHHFKQSSSTEVHHQAMAMWNGANGTDKQIVKYHPHGK